MPTTSQIIAARDDRDLRDRLTALASLDPAITNPSLWVEQHIYELVAADIGDTTVATVYEYAAASYKPTPAPGADGTKVTDTHLVTAIESVKTGKSDKSDAADEPVKE